MEVATLITSRITQPLKGVGLSVLYLAKRVCCQLVGADVPRVPMDTPQFMLSILSMIEAKS